MTPMKRSLAALLAVWLGTSGILPASAGLTDLANIPLAESSAESVPPNIYFILDDSGSMASDYMPDYVDDSNFCPDSDSNGSRNGCVVGDPPYSANVINGVYYNPATRYRPPKWADGTEWGNASKTTPRNNPFYSVDNTYRTGSYDNSTKTLTSYQNTAWCKTSSNTPTGNPATDTNCAYYPLNTDITDYPRYPDATYLYRKTYNGPPVYYTLSGTVQWCNSAFADCRTRRDSSHTYPKFTGSAEVSGVRASRSFYVIQAGGTSGSRTKTITFDGTTIASITVNYASNTKTNRIDLANKVITAINGVAGWTATLMQSDTSTSETTTTGSNCRDGTEATYCARILVTAPGGATSTTNANYNKNFTVNENNGLDFKSSSANLSGGINYVAASAGATFRRIHVKTGETYTKYAGRSDCAGASCTYDEELQNFANWYSFYRTRMLMMKTGTSRAFASLDDNYRVGYSSISYTGMDDGTDASPNEFLNVRLFDTAQKTRWYKRLFAADPSSYTPLRGALSKAGRYYTGQLLTNGIDPITHSCQQNFTILSTDGYWNTNEESSTYGPFKEDNTTAVGDQDGPATVTAPSRDVLAKASTLADVAYYYYHTDLRTSGPMAENNVPRAGTNQNTDDVATHQHMTTFTVGLGVDGTLRFVSDYRTNTSSSNDYYNILQGSAQWPDPIANSGDERVDDLWHAAVNGRGTYFSARDPDSLVSGLQKALSSISQSLGSGAAAATSNLEPVAGDNFIYVGSYRTLMWDGDLAGHLINISTGTVSTTPSWQASTQLNARIGSTGNSDTRTIYSYDAGASNKLEAFTWANLDATQRGYFNTSLLTQYANWDAATQAAVTGEMLLNYIRGQNRNENQDRPGDYGTYYRAFRDRENVLGDLVHSQPVYLQKPPFDYGDTGYAAFKSAQTSRAGAVYVASNDGMVHAFNSQTGEELWAYVPPHVLPTLYKLADDTFANSHQYYVDASPVAGDVYIGGAWKTLLVGGFGKGARGYYALDVTDPAAPKALWNFTEDDLGYSFGSPVITKLEGSGQWVVILPSGYNNVSPGDGKGHLWVLDAGTGALVRKIGTNSGSTSSPSGLAHLSNWVQNGNVDNVTQHVYGGDLDGKVWKFDVVAGTTTLVGNFGSTQPITAPIELGLLDANRVLFFGTGRYLGLTDTANTDVQSIYAIKDVLDNADNPRNNLVQQQLLAIDGSTRTTTENEVNWATKDGWYIDLPDSGERVNLQVVLQLGTLIAISNVPTATACSPGGYSWSYNLNPRSGTFVAAGSNVVAGTKYQNITVGFNVVKLPDGRVIIYRTGHKNPVPEPIDAQIVQGSAGGVRINWREIIE